MLYRIFTTTSQPTEDDSLKCVPGRSCILPGEGGMMSKERECKAVEEENNNNQQVIHPCWT